MARVPPDHGPDRAEGGRGVVVMVGRVDRCTSTVTVCHDGFATSGRTRVAHRYVDVMDRVSETTLQDLLWVLAGRWVRITIEELTEKGEGDG